MNAANPFASRISERRSLITGAALVAIALIIVAVFALRGPGKNPAASAEHVHTAAPAAAASSPLTISADAAKRIGVTFAPVTLGSMTREIRTVAQVTYDETLVKIISPKIDGWVEQLYVNFTGQPVSAGQPFLSVYSPMLVSAQEELILAMNLNQSLSGASSETLTGSSDLAAAARRRLEYWGISSAEIDRIVGTGQVRKNLTLRSPVSGVVIEKNVLAGQKIMSGEALYKIADLSTVWIEGEVFERDLPSIRVGTSVKAEFDALPGEVRTGRVSYLYPTLNPETRTARIRVAMANPGLRLKPGMYATIRVEGAAENAVSVPRSAVLSTGERSLVFVRRADGMLEPRNVTTGESTEDRTRIIAGVKVGETVVASGTFLVDAESNLGSSMGGMGDMPGMDIAKPSGKKE
ncbi:MAG TPA: efflux RND transporter periplasmic adaptor subunit [Gemmatimonadaceae bacterium]|nr:efflux RND transporter periplasmic adaptor subunit [Gemmatimonadaceae bacterium]